MTIDKFRANCVEGSIDVDFDSLGPPLGKVPCGLRLYESRVFPRSIEIEGPAEVIQAPPETQPRCGDLSPLTVPSYENPDFFDDAAMSEIDESDDLTTSPPSVNTKSAATSTCETSTSDGSSPEKKRAR